MTLVTRLQFVTSSLDRGDRAIGYLCEDPDGQYCLAADVEKVVERSMQVQEQLAANVNEGLLKIRQLEADLARVTAELARVKVEHEKEIAAIHESYR